MTSKHRSTTWRKATLQNESIADDDIVRAVKRGAVQAVAFKFSNRALTVIEHIINRL